MVDAVHPRCRNRRDESFFDGGGQFQVAVVEDDRKDEQLLPEAQRFAVDAEPQDLERAKTGRKRKLAEMKTNSRGAVEIEIEMMHSVEAPQERHAMVQAVPDVERVVKQQEPEDEAERARQRKPTQESEA